MHEESSVPGVTGHDALDYGVFPRIIVEYMVAKLARYVQFAEYTAQVCFGNDFQLKRRSAVNHRLVVMRRRFSTSRCC